MPRPGAAGRRGILTATAIVIATVETMPMRPRAILEVLIVMGCVGLLLEIAEGHTWIVVGAGVSAAIWLLARSH